MQNRVLETGPCFVVVPSGISLLPVLSHLSLTPDSIRDSTVLYLIQIQVNFLFLRFCEMIKEKGGQILDTRFSVAVHVLILISESEKPMSSAQMARSTGTNASYIRKILSLLKKGDLIESHPGIPGSQLRRPADQITMLQIYTAVLQQPVHLFDLHQNASDQCIVGQHIGPVLNTMFSGLDDAFATALQKQTLADCIRDMRKRISGKEKM